MVINSAIDLAGNAGFTTSTFGTVATGAIGSKSLIGSNGIWRYREGLIACGLLMVISRV
ncbi:hypothetical protein D3C87_1388970 [compost metagenome]